MRNMRIEVTYSRTYNLGNYSNIKPAASISAELDSDEDAGLAHHELMTRARLLVEEEVDRELERQGDPPVFFAGERYGMVKYPDERLVVVLKDTLADIVPRSFRQGGYGQPAYRSGYRLAWIEEQLDDPQYDDWTILYVHREADIERLPDLQDYTLYWSTHEPVAVLSLKTDDSRFSWFPKHVDYRSRTYENVLRDVTETLGMMRRDDHCDYEFFDCVAEGPAALPFATDIFQAYRADGDTRVIAVMPGDWSGRLHGYSYVGPQYGWFKDDLLAQMRALYPEYAVMDCTTGQTPPLAPEEPEYDDIYDEEPF